MKYFLPTVFILAAIAGVWLFFDPQLFSSTDSAAAPKAQIVSPRTDARSGNFEEEADAAERMAFEDVANAKIALREGETAVAVITQDFDGDPQDEQVIALRKSSDPDGAIYLAFVDFDETTGGYARVWEAPTATTRSRTFSMFVKDLIGDRSVCLVATGMNGSGEQTMTVFQRKAGSAPSSERFEKIAELRTDGSISVAERERSQAYQLGMAAGATYRISIYGRDFESTNLLDQIETVYDYNAESGRYERVAVARIPGAQIEQRRVRQLLDGTPDRFERFLDGLWSFTPVVAGPADSKQFLLFDTQRRELVFYADDTQEVFSWENSNPTRYGLYLTTKNISVTTLRRLIDIELESADAIRIKAFEDVKLKIGVGGRWDGTYRKVGARSAAAAEGTAKTPPRVNAEYEGTDGSLRFDESGTYTFAAESGSYAFFRLEDTEYLELRKVDGDSKYAVRATYSVRRSATSENGDAYETISLTKVRLGVGGAEDLHERELVFKRAISAANRVR